MLLLSVFCATLLLGGVSAFPQPTPAPRGTPVQRRQAAAADPKVSPSVEKVTIEYIGTAGNTVFETEQYTDYGTAIPSDILAEYSAIAQATPSAHDPCGPEVQDHYQPPTCEPSGAASSSDLTDSDGLDGLDYDPGYVFESPEPAIYGVQCMNSSTSNTPINTKNCDLSTVDICNKIRSTHSPKGKWIWSTAGAGCAMGYWLPPDAGAAPAPLKDRCESKIYETMVYDCVTYPDGYYGVANLATVNLVKVPGGTSGTGSQVNAGYPSYIVAAEEIKIPTS